MFEMMLTERCLKVVQDEASSDYEAQQIRNKIGKKKKQQRWKSLFTCIAIKLQITKD